MRADIASAMSGLTLTPEGASARFRFERDLPVFQGHFPGFPIVPGVYLIEGARVLSERSIGSPMVIRSVEMAKFSATVLPDDWVEAAVVLERSSDPITCDARFCCRGVDAARIKLQLARST